jgi:hypothetical protein
MGNMQPKALKTQKELDPAVLFAAGAIIAALDKVKDQLREPLWHAEESDFEAVFQSAVKLAVRQIRPKVTKNVPA